MANMQVVLTKLNIKLRKYFYLFKYQFFTKKVTFFKWQLNIFTLFVLILGGILVTGIGVLPKVLALNETTFSIQNGGDSNFTLGTPTNVTQTASNISLGKDANWFNLSWNYKRQLTIKNNSSATLNANSSLTISIDTSSLESVLTNCNDIRIVYQNATELPITIKRELGSTGCNDSKVTNITFPIQVNLTTGTTDSTNYALYYGNGSASAQGLNGYTIQGGPVATMVCSFNGTTTCETGQTPTTESGAVRYSTKSGLKFNGISSSVAVGNSSSFDNLPNGDFTVESWVNLQNGSGTYQPIVIGKTGGTNEWRLYFQYGSKPFFSVAYSGGTNATARGSVGISQNVWHHIAATFTASTKTARLFVDGTEVDYTGTNGLHTNGSGTYNDASSSLIIGSKPSAITNDYFQGSLDELRISDTVRYSGNFTPSNSNFIPDSNTKLLYHLDENGDDPRNSGKAIDASGNGNNGTITGAKYVGGIVGIDASSTDSGKISNQSYASHSGIFVEEGTTNLIPNPSFENASYNTGWGSNYMTYASGSSTFTPNIAKRTSNSGPFATSLLLQGKSSASGGYDYVTASKGTQISSYFYNNFDKYQGSIIFWITPEWNGNDGKLHGIFTDGNAWINVSKTASNLLSARVNNDDTVTVDVSSWTAGTTYLVIYRWDTKNFLNGSNHACLTINNTTTCGATGTITPTDVDSSGLWLGQYHSSYYGADALIQGFTVYRRPLYLSSAPISGINVGNGDELSQIYNSGSGKDPTNITGSWDVVFALPTNQTAGTLGTTGEAWSHPHSSNLLGGTNGKNGYMMDGTYTNDGWNQIPWWTLNNSTGTVAAYQPIGASSLANSYINKANPGTNDATTGVAPTWSASTGWTGDNSTTYLKTGIIPQANTWSAIARFSGMSGTNAQNVLSSTNASNGNIALEPITSSSNSHYYANGSSWVGNSNRLASGVMAVAGAYGYLNGTQDVSGLGSGGSYPGNEIYLMARNNNGLGSNNNMSGSLQAAAIYNTTLTAAQVASISSAMANLDSTGSYINVSALATNEKIFNGGYKFTSNGTNEGIYKDISTSAGSNFVIRALANSDGTSIPKIIFYDQSNGTEIGSLTGTSASTKGSPDVFIFSGQAPAGCTNIRVKLINTQASGTVYWHQVEVQSNLITNPSLETGTGDPYVPTGWSQNVTINTGEVAASAGDKHSGNQSIRFSTDNWQKWLKSNNISLTGNKFYSEGGFSKYVSGSYYAEMGMETGYLAIQNKDSTNGAYAGRMTSSAISWTLQESVLRARSDATGANIQFNINREAPNIALYDDVFAFPLNDISLTITPASLANSTETSGVRVDGTDTLTQTVSNLTATSGVVKFKYTPRHNSSDMLKYGNSTPYIIDLYGNATNYIRAYWSAANTVTLDINDGNGNRIKSWDATGAIVAGTTYNLEISYSSTQILFKVDGVTKIDMTPVANWWTAGGASGAVGAYQAVGASSLANSYVNKANPGTNDLTAGGAAPAWTSTAGWTFNGQYLNTGIIPSSNWSMIINYNNVANGDAYLAGEYVGGTTSFAIAPNKNGQTQVWFFNGGSLASSPMQTAGNLAMGGSTPYKNGLPVGIIGSWSGTALYPIDIGGLNQAGTHTSFISANIQSIAIYNMVLSASQIAAITGAMNMITPLSFSVVPTTAYFGSKQDGTNQADATYSNFTSLTPTQNSTAAYYKFGSNSAKLVNGGTLGDEYTTSVNVGNTATDMLSAYVYDGTAGNIGGTVNNTIAELYYNNSILSTTYNDMGGGWWRLTGSLTGVNQAALYGVSVKAGKTIYLDGVQLEASKGYATTYTDGSLGTGYSWSGSVNNSSSSRVVSDIQYTATGNISNGQSVGSMSFWYKPNWDTAEVIATASRKHIISSNITTGNYFDLYYTNSGGGGFIFHPFTGASNFSKTIALTRGTNYNILLTWNNGNGNICVNNQCTSGTYTPTAFSATTLYFNGHASSSDPYPANATYSDLRIFNQSLSTNQISDIYYQSLTTHSQATSNQQKYASSGTWESPVINLNSNAQWGSVPNFVTSETLNGNTVSYQVRTSGDANTWTSYTANTGSSPNYSINALAQKYIQVKATLNSASQLTTPTVSSIGVHYVQDTTPPITNASNTTMKSSLNGRIITKTTGWTNDLAPYFRWDLGADNIGGSGIKGYCLSLSQSAGGVDPVGQKGLLGTSPVSVTGTPCQFIVGTNEIDFSDVSLRGNTWLSTSDNPYYLNIKAIDNTGNTYITSETFDFKYDDIPPINVTSFSAPQNSFANVNDIYFNWPVSGNGIASDANSQLLGYQYSLNNETDWTGSDTSSSLGLDYIPIGHTQPYYLSVAHDASHIQMGNNTIYFKAIDIAGNKSTVSRSALISYGGDAPKFADGSVITITPETSTSNMYSVSWPSATPSTGRTLKSYYYMINTTPPNLLSTILSNSSIYIPTTSTTIPEGKLVGAVKGQNTIYVVSADDLNNYSAGNALSKTFTLNSLVPDPVLNLRASDASIKSVSLWSVSLAWNEPVYKGTGVLTYEIDRSEDGTNWTKITETNGTAFVDTVPLSKKYYYRIGSMDNTDESKANPSYSLSVSITPKGSFTEPAPLVSNPVTSNVTTKKATISWVTGRTADSRVSYGLESGKYFQDEIANSKQVTEHVNNLVNLQPATTYYYKARWTDEDGNIGESTEQTFVTEAAPEVKNVNLRFINTTSAQVQFTTNKATKVKIYYGKTTQFGAVIELPTSQNESTYTVNLEGLTDGTKYYYRINPFDIEDSEYEGTVLELKTLPKPTVSNIKLQQIKNTADTTILVNWTSNTEISSIITYFPEGKSTQSRDQVNLALISGDHKLTLNGLTPDITYNLIVKGYDRIGNEAKSDIVKFTTASDTRPPVISEMTIEVVPNGTSGTTSTKSQVVISWNTDEPATTSVEYGEGYSDNFEIRTQTDFNLTYNHMLSISGLEPSKVYHFKAVSKDKANNVGNSSNTVAITSGATSNATDLILNSLKNLFNF
ncbi:MAG: LamG-like jellyroll fold domain-containing protein [bacterium]